MAVAGYEYRVDGGTAVDVGNVLLTTVTGLDPDTFYDFEVRAYDGSGNFSAWSSVVTAKTAAELPAGVFNIDFDPDTIGGANNDPVATWTDSISSNVVTQATGGNKPVLKTSVLNGHDVIEFDGTNDYLEGGDFGDLLNKSTTVFVLAKKTSSDFAMFAKCDGSTVGGYAGIGLSPSYGGAFYNSGGGGQNNADLTGTDSAFSLYEFRFYRSLAYVEIWKDGVYINRNPFTPDEGTSRNTSLNYSIGRFSSGLPIPFGGQIARILQAFHTGQFSNEYIRQTRNYINSTYGVSVFSPDIVITCEGDSLTEGAFVYGMDSYPGQLATSLDANYFRIDTPLGTRAYVGSVDTTRTILVRNVGEDGAVISAMESDAADQVDQEFFPGRRNILVFNGGINDFASDAATVYGYIQTYCENRKTANPDLEICVCTLADAGGGRRTEIDAINALIRANYTDFADSLADVNLVLNDYTNLTYFNVDEIHHTTAGYGAKAAVIQAALGL